jgi:GlpG protein
VQGIETQFEEDEKRWAIWVHAEEHLATAARLLEEFRANPRDPRFQAGSPAEKLRQQAEAEDEAYHKRVVPSTKMFRGLTSHGFGFVTYAIIVLCGIVFFLSHWGNDLGRIAPLFITEFEQVGDTLRWLPGLPEFRHGEVWRIITPIFIHMTLMHILFNMLWLRDLGSMFEARLGGGYFTLFVLVVAAGSNLAEYLVGGRPNFGGMSGVVYGLIGYCWIRGRFDPAAGVMLDRQSWIMAMIWFAICFIGVMPVANYAHAGGLLIGMGWAFVDSKRR